jgi:hypothetical protein
MRVSWLMMYVTCGRVRVGPTSDSSVASATSQMRFHASARRCAGVRASPSRGGSVNAWSAVRVTSPVSGSNVPSTTVMRSSVCDTCKPRRS